MGAGLVAVVLLPLMLVWIGVAEKKGINLEKYIYKIFG